MPFKSSKQSKACFATGGFGGKVDCKKWAHKTDYKKLKKKKMDETNLDEVSPPGFSGTVKAMKRHPELTKGKTKKGKEKNVFALAWWMKNKGAKAHYKEMPGKTSKAKGEPKKKEKYKNESLSFKEWLNETS